MSEVASRWAERPSSLERATWRFQCALARAAPMQLVPVRYDRRARADDRSSPSAALVRRAEDQLSPSFRFAFLVAPREPAKLL